MGGAGFDNDHPMMSELTLRHFEIFFGSLNYPFAIYTNYSSFIYFIKQISELNQRWKQLEGY